MYHNLYDIYIKELSLVFFKFVSSKIITVYTIQISNNKKPHFNAQRRQYNDYHAVFPVSRCVYTERQV